MLRLQNGPAFASHNLTPVAKVTVRGGFVLGSLNGKVGSLSEHLGDVTRVIDMLTDQCEEGIEVFRGTNTCIYRGNWKLLIENGGGDGLHRPSVHKTLLQIVNMREEELRKGANQNSNNSATRMI